MEDVLIKKNILTESNKGRI